jgi:hypothetical protein
MPARDRFHDTVKRALIKDDWDILDEQFYLNAPNRRLWIDLRAQKETENRIILVEVKSFLNIDSEVEYLAQAMGKYRLYQLVLRRLNITYPLYLAVPRTALQGILGEPIGRDFVADMDVKLLIFDPEREEIWRWRI